MFAAAVSLVTGKILYISDQVASIFHCKRDTFYDAKFVEFLAPHDVSVFHSSTTPYKLPPWSICGGAGEGPAALAALSFLLAAGGGGDFCLPGVRAGLGPPPDVGRAPHVSSAGDPYSVLTQRGRRLPSVQAKDKKLFVQNKFREKDGFS